MRNLVPLGSLILLAAFPAAPHASQLLVVNQADHTVSFVDPVGPRQTGTFDELAVTGHEVATTPDGRTAFVPIYGDSGVGRAGSDGSTLEVIDIATRKLVHTVDFRHGVRPHCAVYDRKRNLLYVTTELDQSVTILNPATYSVIGSIPTGQAQSHMLVLSHDGRFGYTANVGPGTISVLDLESRKVVAIVPVSGNTQRISISNDDRFVFTADQTRPQLAVLETATNRLIKPIPLPGLGYGTAATPDGRWLLAAMRPLGQIAVIDAKTLTYVRSVNTGGTPTEILVRPDGKVAYVSCIRNVVALDIARMQVAQTFDAGAGADGLAWAN